MAMALAVAGGCAAGESIGRGAVLSVYVAGPVTGPRGAPGKRPCAAARSELAAAHGRAGFLRVRVVCVDDSAGAVRWSLSAVGANARRAVEDSSTVAYIGDPGRIASRFSRSIVEEAGIPQLSGAPAGAEMRAVLAAIRQAGNPEGFGELRESVGKALGGG